jgi:hypothetical protein
VIVVDDHLLLDILAGVPSIEADKHLGNESIATTLSWFFRLGRALDSSRSQGSLSRRFSDLTPDRRTMLRESMIRLPENIHLVETRTLVPVMIAISNTTRANLLTADALATALTFDPSIAVTTNSPLLLEVSALTVHVDVRVIV